MKTAIEKLLNACIEEITAQNAATCPDELKHELHPPRSKEHGDLASNLALKLAPVVQQKPREVAQLLKDIIDKRVSREQDLADIIERVEIAGPGFLNFKLKTGHVARVLAEIQAKDTAYGSSDYGKGQKRGPQKQKTSQQTGTINRYGFSKGSFAGNHFGFVHCLCQ